MLNYWELFKRSSLGRRNFVIGLLGGIWWGCLGKYVSSFFWRIWDAKICFRDLMTFKRLFIIFLFDFYRYSYVVHPLAYRDTINQLPDNSCVDAIQWSILNINNKLEDPHYNNPKEFYNPCLGLELFNDFPYSFSYNSELQTKPMDDPDFTIPCFNGKID